jgi:DNA-binding MarR family transcriptional regulator
MPDNADEPRPNGEALGLPDYLAWIGNQLTASAVAAYATLGIGFLEARVLLALGRTPELAAPHLVQRLGVDRAAISRALQQLRGAELIVADDQRRLSLSATGWEVHAEAAQISEERLALLTERLTTDEREVLMALLQRLHHNLPKLLRLNGHLVASVGRSRRLGRSLI